MSQLTEAFVRDILEMTNPDGANQHAPLTVWEEHQLAHAWLKVAALEGKLTRATDLLREIPAYIAGFECAFEDSSQWAGFNACIAALLQPAGERGK